MPLRAYPFTRLSGLGPLLRLFEAEEGWPGLQRLLASVDIPPQESSPSTPIPFASLTNIFNQSTRLTGDALFSLRVGLAMRPEDFGPFVAHALGAESLGAAIRCVNRTIPLQTNALSLRLRVDAGEASWSVCYVAARGLGVHHHAIHVLAPMIGFLRRYTGSAMRSVSVDLASTAVAEARSIEQVIGLPVRANRDGYSLVFPAEWLRLRRPQDQPRQIVSRREMMAYYRSQPRLPATTTDMIAALLAPFVGDTRFDIDAIAEKLGVSRRTLQLRLGAEGTTFRSVSLAVRMKQAQRLILDSPEPIAQVAMAVGYSDQAHFSRAFVDLHGATPNEFRRRAREHL